MTARRLASTSSSLATSGSAAASSEAVRRPERDRDVADLLARSEPVRAVPCTQAEVVRRAGDEPREGDALKVAHRDGRASEVGHRDAHLPARELDGRRSPVAVGDVTDTVVRQAGA